MYVEKIHGSHEILYGYRYLCTLKGSFVNDPFYAIIREYDKANNIGLIFLHNDKDVFVSEDYPFCDDYKIITDLNVACENYTSKIL